MKPSTAAALLHAVHRLMPTGMLGWTLHAAKRALRIEKAVGPWR